ncbi:M18 family aminopeptidase [Motiliproteus coralliicola]|uniref:M18 family aminopeptidase n=1 Tax=Motiliproteus coralliicola TaxID=2283196 RepID=A0A369WLS3_9GAMM|nr:M18 family aminopeptidase [Motiliproteus coralliicola]RDE22662.1 M18 family aminopeptidase [Motiliproteus coralliicola]
MLAIKSDTFNQSLLDYLQRSMTPFHATANLVEELKQAGFIGLEEGEAWQLEAGGRYYLVRSDASVIAFVLPKKASLAETGLRMVGAHTDSPCLKVKPQPERVKQGYFQLGVEVYGGALLNPWFDRDLSLAGRVSYIDAKGELNHCLVDFQDPIAVVPSLAIHLDREANKERTVNPQLHLPLVLAIAPENSEPKLRELLLEQVRLQDSDAERVLDFDLCCYDTNPPAMIGLQRQFIASARLDNLLSCFVGLQAMLGALEQGDDDQGMLLVCNDHEEVGSVSDSGADGPMLEQLLERLVPEIEPRQRMLANSVMISADNAHGIHPNYSDKHDANHGPLLNAGPVIKINANQRYATNSKTSALFRQLAELEQVPVQAFTVRTDMACGSTIGPLTAARIGVPTLDIGVPTFGMHSIRELAGSEDAYNLFRVLQRFYQG